MWTASRLVLFALFLASCGYRTGDFRSPEQELKVFIPVFENQSVRPLDLNEVTSVLKENLESIKGVSLVNTKSDADVFVLGRIVQYERGWGPTAYKGTKVTEAAGGLREDMLSASTTRITLGILLEKFSSDGAKLWSSTYSESDLYEMSDRLSLAQGSAATPQLHASREALLIKKLTERIVQRARAQIVDDF